MEGGEHVPRLTGGGEVMAVLGQKSHVSRRKVMTGNLPG